MNQILTVLALILFLIIGFYFFTGSNVESISADQLRLKLSSDKNIGIIDVRTSSEYYGRIGHIDGSILISLSDLEKNIDKVKWDSYDEIYTICLTGGRSAKAVNILEKNNIKAINVRGGMTAWNMLK